MTLQDRPQVTIYEVAQRVGVSIATVSRALRGTDYVAPETRRRVLAAVEELQFRPSRLGQSLAEGRHAANGIVFPDLAGPYYSEVVLGYEEVAAELGNSVLILATHGRPDPARKVLELARRVDGMVVMGRTVTDEIVGQVAETGVPTVLLARAAVGGLDTITADNDTGARRLVTHLLGHGYRHLAYLGDPDSSPDVTARYRAFRETLAAAGREPPGAPVRCAFDVDAGHRAARQALAASPRPEVLVCANDEVALGALATAAELGLSVPTDVAITGWDDVMAARYAGLTTVHQPMRELGATAARWLQDRMTGSRAAVRREVLPTRLVVRTSCGPHDPETEEPR
ncbi:LacI family DNA-binding transcriptional regulator [Plantactinospora sp. WMMB334]|uniref:LacI family DNA-binding transcriptional regulator n=1 Tax=Plantactinospora sp. WMMB334 TaxID=3404119 RepID=UPI003B951320